MLQVSNILVSSSVVSQVVPSVKVALRSRGEKFNKLHISFRGYNVASLEIRLV